MRVMKWLVVFCIAFVVSWIVIFTFTQEPFTVRVSARIFSYRTPAIPVYWYVGGSLVAGLGLGLLIAAYTSLVGGTQIRRQKKQVRELETEVERLRFAASLHEPAGLGTITEPVSSAPVSVDPVRNQPDSPEPAAGK